MSEKLYNAAEIAGVTGLALRTVQAWAQSGKIQSVRPKPILVTQRELTRIKRIVDALPAVRPGIRPRKNGGD